MQNRDVDIPWIGTGIYSVTEAASLTKVSASRIRRWLRGYRYTTSREERVSPAVWRPQLGEIAGCLALGFRDLLEVRFVSAFLDRGVTWKTLRRAGQTATTLFGTSHPFSTQRFKTDGRGVFADICDESGEKTLLELAKQQRYFEQVISPYLKGVDFAADEPVRWWPLGRSRRVVLDPQRSFGQPIVAERGVPTSILASAWRTAASLHDVVHWFAVDERSVRDAIEFEEKLAA
jgi:uncharacterized protein (DUF433 family)